MIGRHAAAYLNLVAAVVAGGHHIANHTFIHLLLFTRLTPPQRIPSGRRLRAGCRCYLTYEAKLAALAATITAQHPDVLGVQARPRRSVFLSGYVMDSCFAPTRRLLRRPGRSHVIVRGCFELG